jgi:hypothetical protein
MFIHMEAVSSGMIFCKCIECGREWTAKVPEQGGVVEEEVGDG